MADDHGPGTYITTNAADRLQRDAAEQLAYWRLSNRIKMPKSDIYVPSCHIYVQITLYISKVQYICSKLQYVYPYPATCFRFIYNSQMILHILIQFRYKYFTDFSRYIFHAVSISCKSTWPIPPLVSIKNIRQPRCRVCAVTIPIWRREL